MAPNGCGIQTARAQETFPGENRELVLLVNGAHMTDHGLPTYLTRQYSLSRAQLGTALGAELLSLCQSVTADGRLAPEELEALQQWLHDADTAEMPAAKYLRTSIERVLADGRITPEEYREVYRAVEAILPFEARKQALAARTGVETDEAAAARVERTARQRGKPVADTAIATVTFMVAGVRQEGRPEVIERHARPNDVIVLARRREDCGSDVAITVTLSNGSQIGFVPDDDARQLAPLLDDGCRYEARITEVLTTGRGPIPVVQARVFGGGKARNAAPLQPSVVHGDRPTISSFGPRLLLGAALAVALVTALYVVLT
jgi:HIRAN domain